MNIREAILKAADKIERSPKDFAFCETDIPTACGTPGCALGWVGHFLGQPADLPKDQRWSFSRVSIAIGLGDDYSNEMRDHATNLFYKRMDGFVRNWRFDAPSCAKALRLYADKHHPAAVTRTGLPDIVREIFTSPQPFTEMA